MRTPGGPALAHHSAADLSPADWHSISEELQTALAQQAMHQAAHIVAEQAEMFAQQFLSGVLQDRGASDALRLFAALLRETATSCLTNAGHA